MKILVALDGMDFEKAFGMYVQLAPHCDGFKINHTLLEHSSMFANYEGEVMVDLKLWDTPNSVCSIVEKILETPATMCTVSTLNNEEVFKELHQYSEDIKLLGVTYLTSWSSTEQFEIIREMPYDMWRRHLGRIRKYGFAGIVCSAHDIKDMKDDSVYYEYVQALLSNLPIVAKKEQPIQDELWIWVLTMQSLVGVSLKQKIQ